MSQVGVSANDRHFASFVWQTMGARGLACAHQDIMTAVSELAPEQVQEVYAATLALAKGGDEEAHFDFLRALRLVSAHSLRHVFMIRMSSTALRFCCAIAWKVLSARRFCWRAGTRKALRPGSAALPLRGCANVWGVWAMMRPALHRWTSWRY